MSRGGPRPNAAIADRGPAYYASRGGGLADWWTLLHPPYTAWHLAYVVLGASLAPEVDLVRLLATLLAFFLAVGVSAHALDEVLDRPLGTGIPDRMLWAVAAVSLAGATALGIAGIARVGWGLAAFIVLGVVLVPAYNLEWFGGRLHSHAGFAASWGAFPLLTAYFAQAERLDGVALLAAAGAFALSSAQRSLSTPARYLRRRTRHAEVRLEMLDGDQRQFGEAFLLDPIERALRSTSWAIVLFAVALAVARLA
jgi:hypothetical protein